MGHLRRRAPPAPSPRARRHRQRASAPSAASRSSAWLRLRPALTARAASERRWRIGGPAGVRTVRVLRRVVRADQSSVQAPDRLAPPGHSSRWPRGVPPSTARRPAHLHVLQCHPLNRAHADAILEDTPAYAREASAATLRTITRSRSASTGGAQHPRSGRVRWPTDRHTSILVPWTSRRSSARQRARCRLWMADGHQNEVAQGRQRRQRPDRLPPPPVGHEAPRLAPASPVASPRGVRSARPSDAGDPTRRRPR